MNRAKTFDDYINEEQVYGMFNDNNGKPSQLSKEILEFCLKGLPKNVINNIAEVEPAGWKEEMRTPDSVSNKGQSRGFAEYTVIGLMFKKPMGRNKVTRMSVGIRKRTSGPGSGYLAVNISAGNSSVMPQDAAAEFYMLPVEKTLEALYNDEIIKYMR